MRLLGKLECLGHTVPVIQGTEREYPDYLNGSEGYYDTRGSNIYVRCTEHVKGSPTRIRDVIAHEGVHFLLEVSGVSNYLNQKLRLSQEAYDEVEEDIVRMVTPGLIQLAASLMRLVDLKNLARKIL